MLDKVRETIEKYRMISSGDSVVVGVSGGADSIALLHIMLSLRDGLALKKITAAHLNHKLRGSESERDESFVKTVCKRLEVELTASSFDVAQLAKTRGLSLEEAGREARYDFFSRCSEDKTALAHNLNDSVETMLLNLARGTALRGLAGIPPKRNGIIRPLIECSRDEIEAYCAQNNLEFVTDSSNLSDDFARNKLRHYAVPALLSVNEGFWSHAAGTLEALRLDADFLDALADARLTNSREEYLILLKPLRYRALSKMLSEREISVDGARLSRLNAIIEAGSGAEQLSEKYFFKSDMLGFGISEARSHTKYFCVPVCVPDNGKSHEIDVFLDKRLRLLNTDYEYCKKNIKNVVKGLKNALDYDKIDGSLVLRQKLPADNIKLSGRNCTKTLRKLFQEKKLTLTERERLFVLADDSGVVWVEGFGAAERAAASEKADRILILQAVKSGGV